MNTRRVMVVEDRAGVRATMVRQIKKTGLAVLDAGTRDEAIDLYRRFSFHAALVDIMLTNHESDRGGLEVIEYIHRMNEGTRCVAISGYKYADAPAAAMDIGVDKYVIKDSIRSPGDYIDPLRKSVESSELAMYGNFEHLHSYLACPEARHIWESFAGETLACSTKELQAALKDALGPYLPVLRPRHIGEGFGLVKGRRAVGGFLWTKAEGFAIELSLYREQQGSLRDKYSAVKGAKLLKDGALGKVNYEVWKSEQLSREDFMEGLRDVRRK